MGEPMPQTALHHSGYAMTSYSHKREPVMRRARLVTRRTPRHTHTHQELQLNPDREYGRRAQGQRREEVSRELGRARLRKTRKVTETEV